MPTLLEALTSQDLQLRLGPHVAEIRRGGGGAVGDRPAALDHHTAATEWLPWCDFTYKALAKLPEGALSMQHSSITTTTTASRKPSAPATISSCEMLDAALQRHVMPAVNDCLRSCGLSAAYRRSRSKHGPCWLCVPHDARDGGSTKATTLAVGITRLSTQFAPEAESGPDGMDRRRRDDTMNSVLVHMAAHATRYGFVVTDDALVVLRAGTKPSSSSVGVHPGHHGDREGHGHDSPPASRQKLARDDLARVEHVVVRWNETQPKTLTVKLALWGVAALAECFGSHVDSSYTELERLVVQARFGATIREGSVYRLARRPGMEQYLPIFGSMAREGVLRHALDEVDNTEAMAMATTPTTEPGVAAEEDDAETWYYDGEGWGEDGDVRLVGHVGHVHKGPGRLPDDDGVGGWPRQRLADRDPRTQDMAPAKDDGALSDDAIATGKGNDEEATWSSSLRF